MGLEDTAYKPVGRFFAIAVPAFGKCLGKKFFFPPDLNQSKNNAREKKNEQRAPQREFKSGGREQHAAVNRMPERPVRAACDEMRRGFCSQKRAVILSEFQARPKREQDAASEKKQSDGLGADRRIRKSGESVFELKIGDGKNQREFHNKLERHEPRIFAACASYDVRDKKTFGVQVNDEAADEDHRNRVHGFPPMRRALSAF